MKPPTTQCITCGATVHQNPTRGRTKLYCTPKCAQARYRATPRPATDPAVLREQRNERDRRKRRFGPGARKKLLRATHARIAERRDAIDHAATTHCRACHAPIPAMSTDLKSVRSYCDRRCKDRGPARRRYDQQRSGSPERVAQMKAGNERATARRQAEQRPRRQASALVAATHRRIRERTHAIERTQPIPRYRTLTCVDCTAAFQWAITPGRLPIRCRPCARAEERRRERAWRMTPAGRAMTAANNARRRARRKGAEAENVRRETVWKRDAGRCHLCGERADPDAWHLDHIVPLALGGPHTYANVAVSHPACNIEKGIEARGEQLRLLG